MPHVMTLIPGGTAFVPTDQKLDDLKRLVDEIYNWVESTMIPDTLAIAPYYIDALNWGKGCGRYVAWGVFEGQGDYASYTEQMANRYLPMGVIDDKLNLSDVQEDLITEYMGRSWYKGDATYPSPYFVTGQVPDYNVETDTVATATWVKCPAYDGKPAEAGGLSRILAAYKRNVPFIVEQVDGLLEALGVPGQIGVAQSTLGRTAVRQIETLYIAGLMKDWVAGTHGGCQERRFRSTSAGLPPSPVQVRASGRPRAARSTTPKASRTARSRGTRSSSRRRGTSLRSTLR